MKKTVIYARSASKENSEQAIEMQVNTCKEFAKSKGLEVSYVYYDVGSGTNTKRPGFQTMISDVKAHGIKRVLVYSIDRLSRNRNDVMECWANGIEIISTIESIPPEFFQRGC